MNVLYFTNKDIKDHNIIPDVITQTGDRVIVHSKFVTEKLISDMNIDFIVADRARSLIKQDVINLLPKRSVNLHPSYLPWNRGYHPNYWSVVDNTPMGVTIHCIAEGIDTGDILLQERIYPIKDDTLRTIYDRCRVAMVKLFKHNWVKIRNHQLPPKAQTPVSNDSLHMKSDFDGVYETLVNGWDTPISEINPIFEDLK